MDEPGMTRVPQLKKALPRGVAAVVVVAVVVAAATDQGVLQASVLGLGTGALIAAIGLGVVVTFRGSGVLNMAGGALAMYFGYVYTLLEREGTLLLLGGWVSFGAPLPPPLAMLVTIVLAAVTRSAVCCTLPGLYTRSGRTGSRRTPSAPRCGTTRGR